MVSQQRDATNSARVIMWTFLAVVLMSQMVTVSCRYLPTRSQDDRLEKLRDLLRELIENQNGAAGNDFAVESAAGGASFNPHSVMFKRNAPSALNQNQPFLSNYVHKE